MIKISKKRIAVPLVGLPAQDAAVYVLMLTEPSELTTTFVDAAEPVVKHVFALIAYAPTRVAHEESEYDSISKQELLWFIKS